MRGAPVRLARPMLLAVPALAVAFAAPAEAATDLVVTKVGGPAADGSRTVQVTVLNDDGVAVDFAVPARIAAVVGSPGDGTAVSLVRAATTPPTLVIAPGGFARLDYTVRLPGRVAATILTLAGDAGGGIVTPPAGAPPAARPAAPVVAAETPGSPPADTGNAFLGNLSAYQPIYAVYGPGTSTAALIQISFKYQLFGRGGAPAAQRRWADGITFAYTQRMYWDLEATSAPFRNIDFQPELFYRVPARPLTGRVLIGGEAGIRHESNGRDGTASRSVNTVYLHPTFVVPVGGLTLRLGPQAWAYVGDLGDNPDIARYRGNTGLFAEIGSGEGWRISTSSRINLASGRGAVNVEASYPVDRLTGSSVKLYVFGQGFVGYGENLLDYNRHATRLRFGLGFVR